MAALGGRCDCRCNKCNCGWLTHGTRSSFPRTRGEAGYSRMYLTYIRAAERVQRGLLHPGQQQVLLCLFALRAIVEYEVYLRFPNRSRGTFSCLSKRKYPKRRHPGRCAARKPRAVPCAPHRSRTLAQLAERERIALRARTRSSETHRERLRCSACSTGSEPQPNLSDVTWPSAVNCVKTFVGEWSDCQSTISST